MLELTALGASPELLNHMRDSANRVMPLSPVAPETGITYGGYTTSFMLTVDMDNGPVYDQQIIDQINRDLQVQVINNEMARLNDMKFKNVIYVGNEERRGRQGIAGRSMIMEGEPYIFVKWLDSDNPGTQYDESDIEIPYLGAAIAIDKKLNREAPQTISIAIADCET